MRKSNFPPSDSLSPIHPGEYLSEELLIPLGISQTRLASDLGVPFRRVHEIIRGKRGITAETALLLGRYFGMSPEFWLNYQTRYDLEVAALRMSDQLARVRVRDSA